MKNKIYIKTFLTCLFLLIIFNSIVIKAQKTLEFNQVKLITSTTETVPTGKVWKIENIGSAIHTAPITSSSATPAIVVNGTTIYLFIARTTNTSDYYVTPAPFFPIWLPAGTTLATSNNINFISVIEFNEIP
ncbi:MAG TPA: hypothetical protein P5250_03315 [Bacteroidales bacterium]|nr:hypothetical protein [Bacteroidales bacterium]